MQMLKLLEVFGCSCELLADLLPAALKSNDLLILGLAELFPLFSVMLSLSQLLSGCPEPFIDYSVLVVHRGEELLVAELVLKAGFLPSSRKGVDACLHLLDLALQNLILCGQLLQVLGRILALFQGLNVLLDRTQISDPLFSLLKLGFCFLKFGLSQLQFLF